MEFSMIYLLLNTSDADNDERSPIMSLASFTMLVDLRFAQPTMLSS